MLQPGGEEELNPLIERFCQMLPHGMSSLPLKYFSSFLDPVPFVGVLVAVSLQLIQYLLQHLGKDAVQMGEVNKDIENEHDFVHDVLCAVMNQGPAEHGENMTSTMVSAQHKAADCFTIFFKF